MRAAIERCKVEPSTHSHSTLEGQNSFAPLSSSADACGRSETALDSCCPGQRAKSQAELELGRGKCVNDSDLESLAKARAAPEPGKTLSDTSRHYKAARRPTAPRPESCKGMPNCCPRTGAGGRSGPLLIGVGPGSVPAPLYQPVGVLYLSKKSRFLKPTTCNCFPLKCMCIMREVMAKAAAKENRI